jgi:Brp/Blh family beta-carotene 15,15'-monooxygenase
MDFAERNHGRLFLFLTGVFVILHVFGLQPGPALSLGLLVGGVVLLGLPHGALDPMVAKQCFGDRKSFTLPSFYTLYVAAALLYTLVWWRWPAFGLASFLAIAAYHFGSDWEDRGSLLSRCAYGSTIVTVPALSHPAQVAVVYEALGVVHPHLLIQVSTVVAVVAGCVAIASAAWRRCWSDLMEQLCIVAGAILLQPLLFFVCYFALLHSPRHLLHTARSVGISRVATIAQVTAPVLLATLVLAAVFLVILPGRRMDERILYVVFVGLAALTVPHMILERLARRAAGRRNGAATA